VTKAAALLLLLLAGAAAAMPRKPRVDRSMETEGSYCRVTQPGHEVVSTPAEWDALWKKIGKKPPSADLVNDFAVAVFAGTRNSGGYGIVFDPPVEEKGALVIRYAVTRPKGMATMALTQPYAVRLFPRRGKLPVRVEGREE
jgi:hypothetical protein